MKSKLLNAVKASSTGLRLLSALALLLALSVGMSSRASAVIDPEEMNSIYSINNPNECLDVTGGGYKAIPNNVPIEQWGCHGTSNQLWRTRAIPERPGFYYLVSVNSGRCLTVPNASKEKGKQLIQYDCQLGVGQQWFFWDDQARYPGMGKLIISRNGDGTAANPWMCVDVSGAVSYNGAPVIQWPCFFDNNHMNQQWGWR